MPNPAIDFLATFESAPDAYLLLAPDAPRFTILAANRERARVTMRRTEDIIGRPLFEAFPDNPDDPSASGVRNLTASLEQVLRTGKPHRMALQKYDIRRPDGSYEVRYWDPLNSPVVDENGKIVSIIHRVEDVTAIAKLRESEERYRLLLDMIPQNIWTTDASGQHRYFSRRWFEFTGAGPEESHGMKWMQFIHPDDKDRMLARWNHSLATGEPYEIEYRFRDRDGQYHWFLGKALPLRDKTGRIVEWFGTATDISESKRHTEEIRSILESITDAFFAVDRDWRFTYVNREAERLLQRARADLIGRVLWDEFTPAVGSIFEHHYQRAMATNETVKFEGFYEPLGIWVDVRAYPSDDGLSVFFRDITRRKRAEEQLRKSEEQFRLLADMVPQHIWTADPDGQITYASRRWYEFTGKTPEQSLGEAWIDSLHPDDREPTLRAWEHSLRTGQPLSAEYRFRKKTGEYCWFLGRAIPERDASGRIVRWFGTLTDISERKQFEQQQAQLFAQVRENEERFRVLANTIPQLAWMADETGSIFWYNDRWLEYTGTTLDEMRGWGWQSVHHPDYVKGVVERIRHSFETGELWEDTFPLRGRDGKYRWFLSRATPIRDASGKITRWFGTNTDVTDQMEAAAERERVTESRTRLMRGFSHDVKNPLGAADGFAQLLEDGILGELTEKQRDSVRRIRRSIQTSLRLIHELLELARAEAGELEVHCVPTNISALVREAAEDVRAQTTTKQLGLLVRVPDGIEATTDPVRVRQVLSNLLSNAVKYTEAGSITVEARTNLGTGRREITVTDTGAGIPADKQEAVFQEFTRLDPEAQSGAGVGLAISRRIARMLGGDITLKSEPGRGSTFSLSLPEVCG